VAPIFTHYSENQLTTLHAVQAALAQEVPERRPWPSTHTL